MPVATTQVRAEHEADSSRGLGFVKLESYAQSLVSAAARKRARFGDGIIIPLFSNSGFLPFLRNLICSMRRLSVHNWLVIAMDNKTCPALMGSAGRGEQTVCVYPYDEDGAGVTSQHGIATYRSVAFNRMVMQRPLWVRFLLKLGLSVIQCDLDIVWLRDPQPLLRHGVVVRRPRMADTLVANTTAATLREQSRAILASGRQIIRTASGALVSPPRMFTFMNSQPDLAFQSEQGYGLNGGFYFARPTWNTIAFFDDWIEYLQKMINASAFEEQWALNGALNRVGKLPNRSLFKARLSEREFPNGKMWWSYPMDVDKRIAYIVHVNWVKSQKKSRMLRDRLWFLKQPGDTQCDSGFDPLDDGGWLPCSKLCSAVGYAPVNGNVTMKACARLNMEDDVALRRVRAQHNQTGRWPDGLANVFWHPMAYKGLQECSLLHPVDQRIKQPPAWGNCTRCSRKLAQPLADSAFEAAFGLEAKARGPPHLAFDAAKPW